MVESIITVVLEVAKCLAPPTERQFSYVRNYTSNIQNLRTAVENLKNESASIQHTVEEAERQGEVIEKKVEKWLASVSDIIDKAEKFMPDEDNANKRCFKGLCPDLKTRHQVSKEAERLQEAISRLREDGEFDRISYRSIPEDIGLKPSKEYEAMESRMSTLKDIISELKNPDVNMIGIFGMGGIGKTTLVKEVARQVESDKLFNQVVFAEVSESQDIRKIQEEIADKLGVKFEEKTESGRARSLCDRLKKEQNILLILDNIWEKLDLQAVGIPHGDHHKGCKILLTARSEDTLLRKMDCQKSFSIGVLDQEEAWMLFKKMAGDYIERSSEIKSIAMDVVKECAGLPISIVTVARALRNGDICEWKDALRQLREPSSANFNEIQPDAYSAIELSYNKLKGDELKKIFLLIGYTNLESIEDLLMYGMGLGLFQGINKMGEVRIHVRTLVQRLKASSMLLAEDRDENISMHDVVRDVAIAIASREQNVLAVTNAELVNRCERSDESIVMLTSMVLRVVKNDVLPGVLECPQMKFVSIRGENYSSATIPDNFFMRMIKIRVLMLVSMNLPSLSSSLGFLTNLRTLYLYNCKLQDIIGLGNLKMLEILCLGCHGIEQLPEEISELTRLKLLRLNGCGRLQTIPPNILPKLSRLEELYFPYLPHFPHFPHLPRIPYFPGILSRPQSIIRWGEEVEGLKNASLEEFKYLPNLTSLYLHTNDVNTIPRGLYLGKLERYNIRIGKPDFFAVGHSLPLVSLHEDSRTFVLGLNSNICLKDGLIVPLNRVEYLLLSGLQEQDIKNFVCELGEVGSLQLKHLAVGGCDASNQNESRRREESTIDMRLKEIISENDSFFIEKVASPNLKTLKLHNISNIERIWQNSAVAMSCGIQNLMELTLWGCVNLRCLFSSSMVSSFVQLQKLMIWRCPLLEEIIVMDQAEKKNILFPKLKYLWMRHLEKLKSFCTGDVRIKFPSLDTLQIEGCPKFTIKHESTHDLIKKVLVFPNLETLTIEAKHIPYLISQFTEDIFYKFQCLIVTLDESAISSLFDFLQRFHTLKDLQISGYDEVEGRTAAIVIGNVNGFSDMKHIWKHSAFLDNLKILGLEHLKCDNLNNLVPSSTTFHNLTIMEVFYCDGFIKLLTSSTAKSLMQLEEMIIEDCQTITEIVEDDEGDNATKYEIVFKELKVLELSRLNSLESFCSGNCAFKFPSLERLEVFKCPNMKIFSRGELSTPILHEVVYEEHNKTGERDLNTTIKQQYNNILKRQEEDQEATKGNHEENDVEGNENSFEEEELGQHSMQLLE